MPTDLDELWASHIWDIDRLQNVECPELMQEERTSRLEDSHFLFW